MELSKIHQTARFLKKAGIKKPSIGIILGTGLGQLARSIKGGVSVDFKDCPNFPHSTSIGHAGRVVYGMLKNKSVIAMEGRFHYFEGYSLKEVTYPVRVMKALGVKSLILSNAAGGLNPDYKLGDLMVISDHINLMGESPLVGPNDEKLGPRFPDMSQPYDSKLIEIAEKTALKIGFCLRKGVYVAVKGPQLETKAEYRFLRQIGSDAVGMSTVPEVIAARHAGLRTIAFSSITDLCFPDCLEPVDIKRILKTAEQSEPALTRLVSEVVQRI